MELSRQPRRRARENIVPLVNVVFLLLIFFLLAGTLRGPEPFEIEPPESAPGLARDESTRTLSLARDGTLALDGQAVQRAALGQALLGYHESSESSRLAEAMELVNVAQRHGRIRVRADRRARAEHLLPLLETLAELGFDDVALVTRDAS